MTCGIFIDSDNTSPKIWSKIYAKIVENEAIFGRPLFTYAFGDFIQSGGAWNSNMDVELVNVQSHDKVKNSTDMKMFSCIRDALETNMIDWYIIVSCDADFSHACRDIRKKGKYSSIISQSKVGQFMKNICDMFIPVNNSVLVEILENETLPLPYKELALKVQSKVSFEDLLSLHYILYFDIDKKMYMVTSRTKFFFKVELLIEVVENICKKNISNPDMCLGIIKDKLVQAKLLDDFRRCTSTKFGFRFTSIKHLYKVLCEVTTKFQDFQHIKN